MTGKLVLVSATALMTVLALATAHAQNASTCGPEVWSTDKMTYTSVPCSGGQTAEPQAATAPAGDAAYCRALLVKYDALVNKEGKSGGMLSTDNAANVAAEKCRAGDTRGIPDLEKALKDARVDLPAHG